MNRLFLTVIMLMCLTVQGMADNTGREVALVQNPYGREYQLLNGAWNYIVDQQEVGYYSYRREPYDTGFFLNHKPTDKNELMVREAERRGIMVWSEIPVYWTISWENPATYANAEHQLDGMMTRDHNRGNIIIWSIANETPHSAPRDAFLSNLARFAHQKDSTRLISMAMEVTSADHFHNRLQDNMNQYVDVISFNQYIGWYRDVDDALKMTWEIPYNKPVIISEMGGGAVAGRHGDKGERWTEEFQEELYRQNFVMLDKIDGLAGVSPWILKDFMSPRRPLYGTQTWFNRKGLFSDQGLKKKAFYVVKKWYEGK